MTSVNKIEPDPNGFVIDTTDGRAFMQLGDTLQMTFTDNNLVLYCYCLTPDEARRRDRRLAIVRKWKRRLGWFWLRRLLHGTN